MTRRIEKYQIPKWVLLTSYGMGKGVNCRGIDVSTKSLLGSAIHEESP